MSSSERPGVGTSCQRCGGPRVDVRVAGTAELVAVNFERADRKHPGVGVSGVACTVCGHIELYATEPEKLA